MRWMLLGLLLLSGCHSNPSATTPSEGDWPKLAATTPRSYVAGRAQGPITIDGKGDDPAWAAAPWTEDFADIEGSAKPAPRFRTRAKLLWDDQNLYVFAQLQEPHVWGTITKKNEVIFYDNDFEVFIDPNGDNLNYYEFEMNALNTIWELTLVKPYRDGGPANLGTNLPGLKSAVAIDGTLNDPRDTDRGWSVEIAFPWKDLARYADGMACPPKDGAQWRMGFSRVEWLADIIDGHYRKIPREARPEDNWVWSPQGVIDMHRPERWAYVQFSTAAPGAAQFHPDPTLATRDQLMQVYYRQKDFQKQTGHYADSAAALGLSSSIRIQRTGEGYTATLPAKLPDGSVQELHVRQDSKLWAGADTTPATQPVAIVPPPQYSPAIAKQLARAGANRDALASALAEAPADQRPLVEFLIANMPETDLQHLSKSILLENVRLAAQVRKDSPWSSSIPEDVFLNDVLPYSSVNERRENWRSDFHQQFWPWVKDCKTAGEAALILNERLFKHVNVRYHPTKRPKADQSPQESIACGYASCSGLSILLIDACRAVGVPARFVGTPAWTTGKGDAAGNHAGNHSWVEVWDGQWHILGASEVSPLDQTWFLGNASKSDPTRVENRIYASSFRRTATHFPLVWDLSIDWVDAEDVTYSYLKRATVKLAVEGASKANPAHVRVTLNDRLVGDFTDDGSGYPLNVSAGQTYQATIGQGPSAVHRSFTAPAKGDVTLRLSGH